MPIGEIVEKFRDAISMFWQSLDEQERKVVLFYLAYVGAATASSLAARRRERLRAELTNDVIERLTAGAR